MQLISINIGKEESISGAKSSGKTGIFKRPQSDEVTVTTLGLEGDHINDTKNHGGPDQAIYIYSTADYAWWEAELDKSLAPGTFGENLTVTDIISSELNIGDRLIVGEVVLEVTDARIPCVTLAARMGDPTFVKRFTKAERPGAYCRVIMIGKIKTGTNVELQSHPENGFTIRDSFRLFYNKAATRTDLERALAAPISIRSRNDIQKRLNTLPA